jgi:hypothetical protein
MNNKWLRDPVWFDQQDYRDLSETYWDNYHHRTLPVELSEAQTSALVARCREEKVTVNSALAAAFVGGQTYVQGVRPFHSSLGIAASLRDRLSVPVGDVMGFFAAVLTLKHKVNRKIGFWENARRLHRKVRPLINNKTLFKDPLVWCHVEPALLEAINFKKLGGLVSPNAARFSKLSAFAARKDVVSSLLAREKWASLDRIIMGTAVTNLTRLDFPKRYGELELDRLILQPGGAFPLTQIGLVLGAVTCSGKLSLVLEYAEEAVDTNTMRAVRDEALGLLLDEESNTRHVPSEHGG